MQEELPPIIEKIILRLVEKMENTILVGKSGVGKTTIIKKIIRLKGNVEVIPISPIVESKATIIGPRLLGFCKKVLPKDKGSRMVVVEDVSHIPSATQQSIGVIMDSYPQTNFIFTSDTVSSVTESIQSRCIIVEVPRLSNKKVQSIISNIAKKESLECSRELLEAISIMADGDIRLATLQMRLHHGEEVTPVYKSLMDELVDSVILKDIKESFNLIDKAVSLGHSEIDVMSDLFNFIKNRTTTDDSEELINLMVKIGDCQAIMAKGGTPQLQAKACLALMTRK